MTLLWTHWVSSTHASNYSKQELFVFLWSHRCIVLLHLWRWFVLATSIARQPFGKGAPYRGQSLPFHEFTQSWLEYELVKVLIAFGLQPTTLHASLEHWSPDLYNLFTYHVKSKKADMAKNASWVVNVLFNKTLHFWHWSKVKFRTMQDSNERQNKTLTLVVLTWLHQLQQYFLQRSNNKNSDWSKLGKYCGTTTNHFKSTKPLAKYFPNICNNKYLN